MLYWGIKMEVGDLVILIRSPFHEKNIFGYCNGDIGLVREVIKHENVFETCLVILFKDFNEYHIPSTYMEIMEKEC